MAPPAGEGAASERAAPQRLGRRVLLDPGHVHVRLDPLIQVVAHEDLAFLAVFLAEPKEPPLLVAPLGFFLGGQIVSSIVYS